MSRVSPTLEGFRAGFRLPSLTFAEIYWRWTVGAIAWALVFFGGVEFLDTLHVSAADAALLTTKQPLLVGRAIQHILLGSLSRATIAAWFAALALAVFWIVLASIGRAATLRALLEYFRERISSLFHVPADDKTHATSGLARDIATKPRPLRPLIGLNFLRVVVTFAAFLAVVGAAVLAGFVSTEKNPHPGLVFLLFVPLAGLICLIWSALNWLLSLAGLFAVRNGQAGQEHVGHEQGTLGAISDAVTFFRAHMGAVMAVSTWAGLAHLTAFGVASTAASIPLAFLQFAPGRLVLAAVILIVLAYLAVADWLYMARLAGYACIAEMPEPLASPPTLPMPAPREPLQRSIDRNELILSDMPGLIPGN
jgi:hypothetical protein